MKKNPRIVRRFGLKRTRTRTRYIHLDLTLFEARQLAKLLKKTTLINSPRLGDYINAKVLLVELERD